MKTRAILAFAVAAMGMAAYNRLHMAVVQSKEMIEGLSGEIAKLMAKVMPDRGAVDFTHGAPTLVVISAKEPDNCPMRGMHYINSGCVAQNMMLAAADQGVGSLVIGIAGDALAADAALKATMGIPDDFTPLFAIALGYDAEEKIVEKTMEHKICVSRV